VTPRQILAVQLLHPIQVFAQGSLGFSRQKRHALAHGFAVADGDPVVAERCL
jgi:hypothetical protein